MPTKRDVLRKLGAPKSKPKPLWSGPTGTGPNGGVSQSMIKQFLTCRERFRVRYVEGLEPLDAFNHRIEYGNMWHLCEEWSTKPENPKLPIPLWQDALKNYGQGLCLRYPTSQEEVNKWYNVCLVQFPVYLDYWSKHDDERGRQSLMREQVFDVPYKLPSGRVVRLRGKWDGVSLYPLPTGKGRGVYLDEFKTHGEVDQVAMNRQLRFDLQTMTYLVALYADIKEANSEGNDGFHYLDGGKVRWIDPKDIHGVRYNVIRRPLSGGKGSIVQHKATAGAKCPKCKGAGKATVDGVIGRCSKCGGAGRTGDKPAESNREYYERLRGIIAASPTDYFWRWRVEVTARDVERFRRETLDPVLEQMCDWYLQLLDDPPSSLFMPVQYRTPMSWRHPFGCENWINEAGWSDVDDYLDTGNAAGLRRADKLFRELN